MALQTSRSAPHAVVIGSGFGGLASAIRLLSRGFRVTVIERLATAGGRARVFEQDGFRFDAGPTIITAPFLFEELWALCGRRFADDVSLVPLDPFYAIRFEDGFVLTCTGDREAMKRQIHSFAPNDVDGYEQFMRASEAIYRIAFEELGHRPFGSLGDMLKLLPDLFRLQSFRTVHGLVSRYVRDPRLRFALSFHPLFVGGNPFTTTSIYGLIAFLEQRWGVHFAVGGTGTIVAAMLDLIRSKGGEVRFEADADEIELEGRRVRGVKLKGGERIAADLVVSDADAAFTYGHLLRGARTRRWNARRLERSRYSMSLFVWYFGTRRRYDDVPHHTILVGPRYREHIADIFERKVLATDFSLYLHRPTATDPSLAPPGCDAFYVLSPVPHLDADIDWRERAPSYREAILHKLSATVLPDLAAQIVTERIMTPLDFRDELLAHKGAAFGMQPLLLQSAWFRPHNRSEEFEGLYLVGAGTHPGAGLPGVLSSARVLDAVVPDADAIRR